MKKVFKFLLFIILLIPFCVEAKEVTYKGRLHGDGEGDFFTSLIEMNDSYIATSYSYSKEIDAVPTFGNSDIRIFKYKKDTLEVECQRNYGGSDHDYSKDIIQVDLESFVIVGYTYSNDIEGIEGKNGGSDSLIIKYDKDCNVLWQKKWSGNGFDEFYAVKKSEDDGFIVVGDSNSNDIDGIINKGGTDAIIVKYDKDGNVVWQKNWGGSRGEHFYDIIVVKDGYIVVGESGSNDIDGISNKGGTDAIIIKYDYNGNVVWYKSYGGSNSDAYNSITQLYDGSLVAIGGSNSTDINKIENQGGKDGIFVKYDENGNIIWQKNWGGNEFDHFNKIKSLQNDFVIVGYTYSSNIDNIPNIGEAIILKYDIDGNMLEQYSFGGSNGDEFSNIIITDSGCVVVGNSESTDIPNIPYAGGYKGSLIVEYIINYDLQKETDTIKNGTYDIKQVGQRAEISLNPDNGYELDKIIVKDLSGNEISYYEENGKYYVDLTDDIVVDVKYKQKSVINPNTTGLIMLGEAIILLSILFGSNYFIKKRNSTI